MLYGAAFKAPDIFNIHELDQCVLKPNNDSIST